MNPVSMNQYGKSTDLSGKNKQSLNLGGWLGKKGTSELGFICSGPVDRREVTWGRKGKRGTWLLSERAGWRNSNPEFRKDYIGSRMLTEKARERSARKEKIGYTKESVSIHLP